MIANRTREIRPSGMRAGLGGNVGYGETVNPSSDRKSWHGSPSPTAARAAILPDPSLGGTIWNAVM